MLGTTNPPTLVEQTPASQEDTALVSIETRKLPVTELSKANIEDSDPGVTPKDASTERIKDICDGHLELKKSLQQVVRHVDRLGALLAETGFISSEDALFEPILEPYGLEFIESLDNMELRNATLKCLSADGVNEAGYIEKRILHKLVSGDDAILQIRDHRLQNYAAYVTVDVLENASPGLQVIILMNRLNVQSSRAFLESFERHLDAAELSISLHVVPDNRDLELGSLAASVPNRPRVFICTPKTMTRLKMENIIEPKAVQAMIVYEAEYVLRTYGNMETISSALDTFESCQVILAAHDGNEDLLLAAKSFSFTDERIVFSMDHANIHSAQHFYYTEDSMTELVLDRVVDLSKENIVIVICHDTTAVNKLKNQLTPRTDVLTISKVVASNEVVSGLHLTTQVVSSVLHNKPHADVKMILNLSETVSTPQRYLEMMASYMETGKKCAIISKVGSLVGLKGIEDAGIPLRKLDTNLDLESYQRVGQTISDNQMEQLHSQLDTFRANLENFARLHRKDIQKDPEFRMHFQKMCGNIGVDPLASSKGYWGELLGVGDFYYELGIQIIDVCLSTRALNGGLMELTEVKRRVERMRGLRDNNKKSSSTTNQTGGSKWAKTNMALMSKDTSMEITEDDVLRSIKTLAPLGSGFQVLQLGDKKMVSSVPRELNKDQSVVLALVQKTNGHVNVNTIVERLGWEAGRSKTALDTLLEDSLMWIDQQAEPHEYWVPGFFEPEDDDMYATPSVAEAK
ncbi:ESCRT-II subunit protein snf8 [Haplosporangium sp. Z 11]|nr:ESCRT-II subunit protein snf8 [Haplosporangium sp. Z 11]